MELESHSNQVVPRITVETNNLYPDIHNIESMANNSFPPNKTEWWTKQQLIDEFNAFATTNGFQVSQSGKCIACTRATEPKA